MTTDTGDRADQASLQMDLSRMGPAYGEAFEALQQAALRRNALSAAEREIVLVAVNAAVHFFDRDGVRRHMAAALKAGAREDEVLAALCIGGLGSHSLTQCGPVVLEELEAAGALPSPDAELLDREERFKDDVRAQRGFWGEGWNAILRLDPEFLGAYQRLTGLDLGLSPRMLELVIVAADLSTTHLSVAGTRLHTRKALQKGATAEDLLEVLEIVTMFGYRATEMGCEVLEELTASSVEIAQI